MGPLLVFVSLESGFSFIALFFKPSDSQEGGVPQGGGRNHKCKPGREVPAVGGQVCRGGSPQL